MSNAAELYEKGRRIIDAAPTVAEYSGFQQAYEFFNAHLFSGKLPDVLVTLQRKAKTYGYFSPQRFETRSNRLMDTVAGDRHVHELALNPDGFTGRSDKEILSTLVHEMVHVWQETHGKAPRRCYHDKQWATRMWEVGLQASSTGAPGGKTTGQHVSHYIIKGGSFDKAYELLKATGYELRHQSRPEEPAEAAAKKASKTKYTCPECGQNAWAKPAAMLYCGFCTTEDDLVTMDAQEA